jgi:signal transduction histidine kinase
VTAAARQGGLAARLAHRFPARSIKRRLVLLFLLFALAVTAVFAFGAQRAFSVGWRDAARPLLNDYVDRLVSDIAGSSSEPPSIERAQAVVARLPITVRIEGPVVNWASHAQPTEWHRDPGGDDWTPLLERRTADGHRISLSLSREAFERRPRFFGIALAALLAITLAAYLTVSRLLRPLDDIGAGAQRFGRGDFSEPIPLRHPERPDELGQLAATVNTMGGDIAQMLEAKRALLLAISHELRSPLTRARLNAELLPETGDVAEHRQALLRDLQEMATLVSDLLESERLAGRHAALNREPTDLETLAQEVIRELQGRHAGAAAIHLIAPSALPRLQLDPGRIRLLLRNLLDNALRHAARASEPPVLHLEAAADGGIRITVRDFGPGVPEEQITRLAQAFYRPDSARTRDAGGVGLGLYLCRLVAQAHGASFALRAARPGLAVTVGLPPA